MLVHFLLLFRKYPRLILYQRKKFISQFGRPKVQNGVASSIWLLVRASRPMASSSRNLCRRDHMARQETRDSGACCSYNNLLVGTNWGPVRTTLIPSKGSTLNDLTTLHQVSLLKVPYQHGYTEDKLPAHEPFGGDNQTIAAHDRKDAIGKKKPTM